MRLKEILFALLGIAFIAAVVAVATGGGDEASAGTPTETYVKSVSGKGSGAANANSTLTLSCDSGGVLLSGGFYSLDEGTKVLASVHQSKTTWKVTWRNDATRDSVGIRILCANESPRPFHFVNDHGGNGVSVTQTLQLGCDSGELLHGGFHSMLATSRFRSANPRVDANDFLVWQTSWYTQQTSNPDEVGVRVLCWEGSDAFASSAEKDATVTGTQSVDADCFFGQLGGGGVRDVSFNSLVIGNRPLDENTWRVTVRTMQGGDPITVFAVCLQPI